MLDDDDDWTRLLGEPDPWRPPRPLPDRIETPRLVVRHYARGDGPAIFDAVARSRDALLPWMLWAAGDHRSVDESIRFVEEQRRGYRTDASRVYFGLFDREGRCLGGSGFHNVQGGTRSAEMGWWIAADARGRGLATEAASALVELAFRSPDDGGYGLRRVVALVGTANVASKRVAQKVGFTLEGTMRASHFLGMPEGAPIGYVDMHLFGLLSDDPRPRR